MKKFAFATLTTCLLLSQNAQASDDGTKRDAIGFGSGVLMGAAVGGPIGGFIGGIMGLMIADDVDDTEKQKQLTAKLEKRESQLVALQREYDQAKQEAQVQLVSLDQQIERVMQKTESTVQFRTASYQLEPHFESQLALLAKGLKGKPDWQVHLAGYADRRGDAQYNMELSKQRVSSVKQFLLHNGVKSKQVITSHHGEDRPVTQNQSFEGDFFDRRVLLRLQPANTSLTAAK